MKLYRTAAAALALTTALTVTACGGDDEAGSLDTLTVMSLLHGTAPSPDGELQKAVEKLIGKKLEITWVPNAGYGDRTNATLASNRLPDVMVVNEKAPAFIKASRSAFRRPLVCGVWGNMQTRMSLPARTSGSVSGPASARMPSTALGVLDQPCT